MRQNIWLFVAISLICTVGLLSCKPTEAGYQKAYATAEAKRLAAQNDEDLGVNLSRLSRLGEPKWMQVSPGDSVLFLRRRVRALDDTVRLKPYLIAVAKYKMPTNAKAQANLLRTKGYVEAVAVQNSDDEYYTIALQSDSLHTAAHLLHDYESRNPSARYIGLPSRPILIH